MGLFSKNDYQNFEQVIEKRRSIYHLEPKSPISDEEIEQMLAEVIKHVPSAFNSQSTRIMLLLGDSHKKFWDMTTDALKAHMGDRDFSQTEQKMNSFKAGYGTVLFFEDTAVIKGLQEKFAGYADNFPHWSQHTNAMHQFAVWTSFATKDIGASLQHYNGIIEEQAYQAFDIPATWDLIAQMPFGTIGSEAGPKEFQPVENRLIIKK